jgi:uncharacterized membrane protein
VAVVFPGILGALLLNLILFPMIDAVLNQITYNNDKRRIGSITSGFWFEAIMASFKGPWFMKIIKRIMRRMVGEYAVYKTQNYIQNKYKDEDVSYLIGFILGSVNRFFYVFDIYIKNGRIKVAPVVTRVL